MDIVSIARHFIGAEEGSSKHKQIIDGYNLIRPLPRAYKVKYDDPWCDAFVSFCINRAGLKDVLGVECGCPSHIYILTKKGNWKYKSEYKRPKSGDLVFFASSRTPDHVGIVETVSGNSITTIEGNSTGKVRRNYYHLDDSYIHGYGVNPNSSGTCQSMKTGYVNVDALNVRTWAGTEYERIKSIPVIYEGQVVEIVNTIKDNKGNPWYYVKIPYRADDARYGFVSAEYITN